MAGPREHHEHPVGKNHIITHPWRVVCRMTINIVGCMKISSLEKPPNVVWLPVWCCQQSQLFDDLYWDEVLLVSTINNKIQQGPLHPHLWMKKVLPLFRICWFFWLNCCGHDNSSGVRVNALSFTIIFRIKFWIRVCLFVFDLSHQWLFWAPFIGVVPGTFVELTPFFGVFLCLPVTLLFKWLGLVFGRLFVRDVFVILWLLWICRPEFPFVLVLKFLLNFNSISISSTEWWDVQKIYFSLDVSV